MVGPVVEELAGDYDGKALIGKVNVDHNSDVSQRFGIRNIPTILFLKNGEVVDRAWVFKTCRRSSTPSCEALGASRLERLLKTVPAYLGGAFF